MSLLLKKNMGNIVHSRFPSNINTTFELSMLNFEPCLLNFTFRLKYPTRHKRLNTQSPQSPRQVSTSDRAT